MLEEKKEPIKEVKKKAETKKYTVIKQVTLDEVKRPGAIIEVEVGSDLEKYLLTNKHVNKHGISRSN
jgi:hypothetical protein